MPELPEVETVRAALEPVLSGRRIARVVHHRDALRYPLPPADRIRGRTVRRVRRRGKYLMLDLGDAWLLWHLGMSGCLRFLPEGAPRLAHEHLRWALEGGPDLVYTDPRRFGYLGLAEAADPEAHPWLARLGPEPLGPDFDAFWLERAFRGRRAPVKACLMDNRVVVGVGNIYACEALYEAGIHPARPAGRISRARIERLVACVRSVLMRAIAAGGSTIRDFSSVDGRPGYFSHAFRVYGRAGAPCPRCGATIRMRRIAGRSSHYCPRCQR